jgi:hypothetical protein
MITLLFLSPAPKAGKTALAAALALHLAYQGRRVLALRLGDRAHAAAAHDARLFAGLPFARGRGGAPLTPEEALRLASDGERPVEVLFLEADPGPTAQAAAEQADARVVLVLRGVPGAQVEVARAAAETLGDQLRAVVATAVPERQVGVAQEALAETGLPVLAVLPEDRTLYAPTVADLIEALEAEVILGEPDLEQAIEHILVNPISADPGQPYYARRRNKAVITRSDKTDLQLAALQTQTDLLILTGGVPPSPYTIDRAAGEEVPLLLTRLGTREAVSRLEDVYARSRFAGEAKLERMRALLLAKADQRLLEALVAGA